MKVNSLAPYIAMFVAIIGWGFSTSFIQFGLEYLEPIPYLFYRFLVTTVIMSVILIPLKYKQIRELAKLRITWIIGISEFMGLALQFIAISLEISAGLAALISLLFLIFVPFLSVIFLEERIYPLHMFAVFLGIVGMGLIITEGDITSIGGGSYYAIILLLLSALSYGVYIVFTSKLSTKMKPDTDPLVLFFVVMVIITLSAFILGMLQGGIEIPSAEGWKWIFYISLLATIFPFIGYFIAMKHISANLASILLLAQVLVPFYIDIFYLKVEYSIWVIAGIFTLIVSMIIAIISNGGE